MKSLIFDTGPIISLTTNNLLWILRPMREKFGGSFMIPEAVKFEVIDNPLSSKKFRIEAIQVLHELYSGTFDLVKSEKIRYLSHQLMEVANKTFKAYDSYINIVHLGEMDVLAAAKVLNSEVVVIDERTTRMLIEEPEAIAKRLQSKLHTHIIINQDNLKQLKRELSSLHVIRSIELASLAYEFHILDHLIIPSELNSYKNLRSNLLNGILWGLKLNGCAVSEDEIEQLTKIELSKKN